ncbi:MAG: hypothetical protein EXR98_04970 [Gemmataceae bacterium]|nr:hypothetical protein [Gemmataceae bacterium]
MHRITGLIALLTILPLSLPAQEAKPKQDYTEFSKLLHSMLVKQLPKKVEDNSGWGQRIEVPLNLPFPRLRTIFKVGERYEAPHGAWRRFKGKIEEPSKNLKIVVKDFKQLNPTTYRVVVDADVTAAIHGEWQQWQKGILLIGAEGIADVNVTAAVVCEVGVSLDLKVFPPELKLEPKVAELGLNFVDFKVRGGPYIKGDFGDNLRNDLKDAARKMLKSQEPAIKVYANQALTQSLKEGKGDISAAAILKALPAPK